MGLEYDVVEAIKVLTSEGIASVRSKEHSAKALVLKAYGTALSKHW
jgi:hypothetical protein